MQQLQAIKTAALSDEYAYQQLAHLTENIGARPSGSAGAKAAVAYVAAQMRDLGLDVHLEEVKVRRWVRGVETAALVEYAPENRLWPIPEDRLQRRGKDAIVHALKFD
jgi:carboxypeptidase Q